MSLSCVTTAVKIHGDIIIIIIIVIVVVFLLVHILVYVCYVRVCVYLLAFNCDYYGGTYVNDFRLTAMSLSAPKQQE